MVNGGNPQRGNFAEQGCGSGLPRYEAGMIIRSLLAFGLAILPVSLAAEAPAAAPRPLTADEHAALRCAAAFAIVAGQQAQGLPGAMEYPPLAVRGREFFVATGARLIDEAGLDDAGVKAAAEAEATAVRAQGTAPLMPFCLSLLDAQVPAQP